MDRRGFLEFTYSVTHKFIHLFIYLFIKLLIYSFNNQLLRINLLS